MNNKEPLYYIMHDGDYLYHVPGHGYGWFQYKNESTVVKLPKEEAEKMRVTAQAWFENHPNMHIRKTRVKVVPVAMEE